MVDSLLQKLEKLVKEGETFNWDNFSRKGSYGYPESYTSEYISWKTRVETLLESRFGKSSPVFQNFINGANIRVLGNGTDQFNRAHSYFMGALKSAIDLIDFDASVTREKEIEKSIKKTNKIFVVHGHDEKLKHEVEIFLQEIGLEPIILHRQPDKGQTIIEKIESNSDVGYAIILLTPDDIGYSSIEESKEESEREKNFRARQNVIFEFGYFIGKLGRSRVCCLYKENVELPTDVSGIIYKEVKTTVDEIAFSIIKDLKAIGYSVNL